MRTAAERGTINTRDEPPRRAMAEGNSPTRRARRYSFSPAQPTPASGFVSQAMANLEVLGPDDVDPALCEPTIAVIRQHGPEIQRLVRWLEAEAGEGRHWRPKVDRGARQ